MEQLRKTQKNAPGGGRGGLGRSLCCTHHWDKAVL